MSVSAERAGDGCTPGRSPPKHEKAKAVTEVDMKPTGKACQVLSWCPAPARAPCKQCRDLWTRPCREAVLGKALLG